MELVRHALSQPPSTYFSKELCLMLGKNHDENVSMDGRAISNQRFADDNDTFAEEEQELDALIENVDKTGKC